MSDYRRFVRDTILYIPAQLCPPVVQFATMVAWTHLLDPTGFGVTTFVMASQEFTALIGITWWTVFVLRFRIRFAAIGERQFRHMDNLVAVFATVVQVALTLPMLWLAGASFNWAIMASSAAFFATRTIIAHYSEWARAERRIGVFTAAQLIGSVGGSALSIAALVVLGPYPSAALGAQAIGFGLGLVPLFKSGIFRLGIGQFDQDIFDKTLRYGLPLIVGGIFNWLAGNCIRIIVQFAEGGVGLGLLSVGWGLGQRLSAVLAMLFTAATYPLAVTHLEGGDKKAALAQVSLNGVLLLALLAPAMAGIEILSAPLVRNLVASTFREPTIVILPIAFLAGAIRWLRVHTSEQTMILLEKTRATMYVTIFETAVNVLFGIIGMHYGGIVGATLGILAGTTAACIASFAYSFFQLGLPVPSGGTLLRILFATGVMSVGIRLMPEPSNLLALLLTATAGVAIYGAMIMIVFPECRTLARLFVMRYIPARAGRRSPGHLP
jgi:O-antigen/teichoic acid export membrane protein